MKAKLQAIGMIECNSIAAGIEAADYMVKSSPVDILMLKTICPGKFVVAVYGEVSSAKSALETGLAQGKDTVVDHFLISNVDHAVISAMSCAVDAVRGAAVGVIETFSAAASIYAADVAVKAANVDLVEVRVAMGLGGKAYCLLSGDVASVETAVAAGSATAAEKGLLVRKVVVPSMAPEVIRYLM
mgnify:FL=1